jgi:hypothetical protein|tara:strand:- start:310 stop:741 length:432 start_codon:yes stop_codon:yes gene_type:complete
MAQKDSRRLFMVVPYLYPDLTIGSPGIIGDYHLENFSNGNGTQLIWHNTEIIEPTAQELADAKEDAMSAWWWKELRRIRNNLLDDTDKYVVSDRPENINWVTYRQELRDLPATVTKPDFETLNNQSVKEWNINSLMPTKPSEE